MFGKLLKVFSGSASPKNQSGSTAPTGHIDDTYQPQRGTFLQTLEYPILDDAGTVTGRTWMEAGYNPESKAWVLWHKTVEEMEDVLAGGTKMVLKNKVLFEGTSFVNAYDQMTTLEKSMESLGTPPLEKKTKAKLGGDYFRQFAWREGLMMSRSGRLYPIAEDRITGDNFFDQQDLVDAKAFLDRYKTEKFIPVPIVLPGTDWEKAYKADKERIDQRLRVIQGRFGNARDSFDLALHIVKNEKPEILYAHMQGGFSPKIFEADPAQHFALLSAGINRDNVELFNLLSESGLSFYVRHDEETPVERALREKRYSHLHVMLSRDGVKLANYADEGKTSPALQAIELQDAQAFRMLYLEGIDFAHADDKGWYLIHHAFAHNFMPAIYAWTDEGLPIDFPIEGTSYTGLSIAKQKKNEPMIAFALKQGADGAAPALPDEEVPIDAANVSVSEPAPVPRAIPEFSFDLLLSDATNDEIEKAAKKFGASGGDFNALHGSGASIMELCWSGYKASKPELDRRALIPVFGALGADPSALLQDGTSALIRETAKPQPDFEFIKAVAPFAKNPGQPNADGNDLLQVLQLNANDQASHSRNITAILDLFPKLDLNRANADGFSNIGLAIRLNRANTLKLFADRTIADFSLRTRNGWSYLDLAFTSAFTQGNGSGLPLWAKSAKEASDSVRDTVLGMVNNILMRGDKNIKQALYDGMNGRRPDGRTLYDALKSEQVSDQVLNRLVACGLTGGQGGSAPGPKP